MNFHWAVANKKRVNRYPPDNSQTYGCHKILRPNPVSCVNIKPIVARLRYGESGYSALFFALRKE